jgi:hypothetical protein
VERFDGTRWSEEATLPGDGLNAGGRDAGRADLRDRRLLRLDSEADRWEQVQPSLPTARAYARAVPFADGVLVVGGSTAAGASHSSQGSAVVERFEAEP